jgi:malate permease and related proteins
MNHIILALSVVFPLMLQMTIGYMVRQRKIVDDVALNAMNRLVFRVFLPLLLFLNIYSLEPGEAIRKESGTLLLLSFVSVILITVIMHLLFPFLIKDKKKCSVMIQGIFRSNLVLFGIPISTSVYGEDRIGIVSLMAAFLVPLFNVLAVIILEYYRGGTVNYKKVLLNIIKNPLIIASVIAFILLLLRIKIPELLLSPLSSLSKVATPLAFVVLGGTFHFSKIRPNLKYLIAVVAGKLIFFPMIVFTIAISLGFRDEALVALIGLTASPTAVSSFTMAVEMEADGELAGQIVVFTSIISIITIFLAVYVLKVLHYI